MSETPPAINLQHWAESLLEPEHAASIDRYLRIRRLDIDVLCVAACHLMLQRLQGEDDSVLGVVRPLDGRPDELSISASYVYAEPSESVAAVVAQVDQCLRQAEVVAPDTGEQIGSAIPAFFYGRHGTHIDLTAPIVLCLTPAGESLLLRLGVSECARRFPDASLFLSAFKALILCIAHEEGLEVGNALAALGEFTRGAPAAACDALLTPVAALWGELLRVPAADIGPDTSYFELGGTSLNAFKLVNLVRARYEVELNIREIIEQHTLSAFCTLVLAKRENLQR